VFSDRPTVSGDVEYVDERDLSGYLDGSLAGALGRVGFAKIWLYRDRFKRARRIRLPSAAPAIAMLEAA
jgi:hypothetical protein